MSQPEMRKGMIARGDVFASWWRWLFFSHANYNWERYQGTGFAHAMTPIIKRLYKSPEDVKAALKRHLVFFNTEPDTGGVIHGMTIALEEQRAMGNTDIDDEAITNVKTGLMGPFAGLGDTLKQGIWFSVWQSIGIGLALGGAGLLGPLVYLVAAVFYTWVFGWWVYYQGYVQGQALVTNLLRTGLLDEVRVGAAVLGAVVLGALGAQFVTVTTGINWAVVTGTGADAVTQTFSLQSELFDKLYPKLIPLATILLLVWLMRRGTSAVTAIVYLFGITLGSVLIESVSRYAVADQNAFAVLSQGLPTLIGIAVLIVGALWAGSRANAMNAAVRFIVGFLVVTVVFALLSVGRTEPLQLLSHF
ncbi:MAG: PTS system mannose/fructose/sorbose family transporter subunit IID [Anaerolineae bacterium]